MLKFNMLIMKSKDMENNYKVMMIFGNSKTESLISKLL